MNSKRTYINLLANFLTFLTTFGVSFFLTPYLVQRLGNSAYGFIGLSNNFSSYINLLPISFNYMTSRFVATSIHSGDTEDANCFRSSTFYASIIISLFTLFVSIPLIVYIDACFEIPKLFVSDVRWTFAIVTLSTIVSQNIVIFGITPFLQNRLEWSTLVILIGTLLRILFLIAAFSIFSAKIYFIPASIFISIAYSGIHYAYLTRKHLPQLQLNRRYFRKSHLLLLIRSGMWKTMDELSRSIFTGLDLAITNFFIGSNAMGVVAITKTIPLAVQILGNELAGSFQSNWTYLFTKKMNDELIREIFFSIKLVSQIVLSPTVLVFVFGSTFYRLWLPGKNTAEIIQLQYLTIMPLFAVLLATCTVTLSTIPILTNNLKKPSVVGLILALVSTLSVLILLKFTSFGIYIITGVSSVYWILRITFFDLPYACRCLNIKIFSFYPIFAKILICKFLLFITYYLLFRNLVITNWLAFFSFMPLLASIGYVISFLFLFNKEEKRKLSKIIRKFVKFRSSSII